jgi:tetratricopeptide (TPR) repeat protein
VRWTLAIFACGLASVVATTAKAADASVPSELVREAREHEASHDDLVAARRYSDALSLDPTYADAYLGLGALRTREGDLREAERVFSVALAHIPTLHMALLHRASTRWALGRHAEAELDLEEFAHYDDQETAMRTLASWYEDDGRIPAELATWRRILSRGLRLADPELMREARTMVRALQIIVGTADPVARPMAPNGVRRAIAEAAKRAD